MDHLDQRNFKIGAVSAAVAAVVLTLTVGTATVVNNSTNTAGLVACAKTGVAATDCRVLIYGAK